MLAATVFLNRNYGHNKRRAMNLDLHILALLVATTGIGFLMIASGIHKNALEWRNRSRFCPSCGRQIEGRTCGCTD